MEFSDHIENSEYSLMILESKPFLKIQELNTYICDIVPHPLGKIVLQPQYRMAVTSQP